MNYIDTGIPSRKIRETLADDIYHSWIISAQDSQEKANNTTIDLRQLADQAAFTAIGFAAALLNEEIFKIQNK